LSNTAQRNNAGRANVEDKTDETRKDKTIIMIAIAVWLIIWLLLVFPQHIPLIVGGCVVGCLIKYLIKYLKKKEPENKIYDNMDALFHIILLAVFVIIGLMMLSLLI